MVQAALAGVLSDLRDDDILGEVFYARFMEPRRRSVAAMLARAAERGEIAPPAQPRIISDLLTGPLMLRAALPPIGPIDDTLVNATIEAALTACGAAEHTAKRCGHGTVAPRATSRLEHLIRADVADGASPARGGAAFLGP
jgi:hypothetical protein